MRALLLGVALFAGSFAGQPQSRDAAVYEAVLDHTLRPQVQKYAAYWKVDPAGPVLLASETDNICAAGGSSGVGCVQPDSLRVFDGTHPRATSRPFADVINDDMRQQLANAFRNRNTSRAPVSAEGLENVKLVTAADLRGFDTRKWGAAGYSTLSLPSYAGRYALVSASFTCGGLCEYGWLVLLEQHEGAWRVVANHAMWIS